MKRPRYLTFLLGYRHSTPRDFWQLEEHDIPVAPGVYILVAKPSIRFRYPRGSSPVFYVGQAKRLRDRLVQHLRASRLAKADRRDRPRYWPRYEYAAAFGGRYLWLRTWRGKSPRQLEGEIIATFARQHKSFPVANGNAAWSWDYV